MIKRFISTEESDKLPSTRQEARELGARHYFTGIPCVNGHIDKRLIGTGHCAECDRVRAKAKREDPEYRAKDAARLKAMNQAKKAADIDAYRAHQAALTRAYKAKLLLTPDGAAKVRAWEEKQNRKYHDDLEYRARKVESDRLRNSLEPNREKRRRQQRTLMKVKRKTPEYQAKMKERWVTHYKRHSTKYKAKGAMRRATKIRATPVWVDDVRADEILWMYAVAKRVSEETGIAWEIDHIVPLKGDFVCGLHTPDNLQLLTRDKNREKSNKFEV